MLIPSGLTALDDLANQIASFMSPGVNDGVPVNGINCCLSCLLDNSPARRIGGGAI